jgi:hypothetical protein
MLFAMLTFSYPTAYYVWPTLMSQIHRGKSCVQIVVILTAHFIRECREHHVFMELLKLCPDLEERLVNASEEESELLTDLVSLYFILPTASTLASRPPLSPCRYRRA